MHLPRLLAIPLRIALIAYCFLQFSVQTLWLGYWRVPRLLRRDNKKINARQGALHASHRQVVRFLATLSLLNLLMIKKEGVIPDQPCIVVANHPSLLDFIVFLADLPNAVCLFKPETRKNLFVSSIVQGSGYIQGYDGTAACSRRIISTAWERVKEGHSVVFFPEGTRSKTSLLLHKFRSTPFHIAKSFDIPIQPVAIYCEPLFLGKNQRWWDFSQRGNTMTIRYLPVFHPNECPNDRATSLGLARYAQTVIDEALTEISSDNESKRM